MPQKAYLWRTWKRFRISIDSRGSVVLITTSAFTIDDDSVEYFGFLLKTTFCFLFAGGYYTIEQKGNKLRIIALNSNAFSASSKRQNVDPEEQLEWLEKILNKSVKNKETVSTAHARTVYCTTTSVRDTVYFYKRVQTRHYFFIYWTVLNFKLIFENRILIRVFNFLKKHIFPIKTFIPVHILLRFKASKNNFLTIDAINVWDV